jgi:hypothetical protein
MPTLGPNERRGTRESCPLICRRAGNLRAVQLLLGHTKIEKDRPVFRN